MFTFGKGMPKLLATVIVATGLLHPAIAASTSQAEKVSLPAVDALAAKPLAGVSDVRLQPIFKSGLMEAQRLSTATADGTIYVATGDIPAEWLRDSSAQVRPYLYLAVKDEGVRDYLRRVIARHGKCMQLDPYANAFRADYTVWERKYELDSLLYPIILAWTYWKATGDASIFTADYQQGLLSALATMELEQHHQAKSKFTHETLGKNPVAETGMIWTAFRPSDDPSKYNYLIPSEMMAVVALGELAEIEKDVYKDATAASKAEAMKLAVHNGIQHYAIVHTSRFGDVYAFEVDGLGIHCLWTMPTSPACWARRIWATSRRTIRSTRTHVECCSRRTIRTSTPAP
jgi:meiotically up-regulated gene 157 (Mug157) protein